MGRKANKRERRRKSSREHEHAQLTGTADAAGKRINTALALALAEAGDAMPSSRPAAEAIDDVELDLTDVASLIPEPPAELAPRMRSGIAPRMQERGVQRETVEVDVEDLSLRPDNPYGASPLIASQVEEPAPRPALRNAKITAIVLLAASSAYGVWSAVRDLRAASGSVEVARAESAETPRAEPRAKVTAPAPAKATAASPREPVVDPRPPPPEPAAPSTPTTLAPVEREAPTAAPAAPKPVTRPLRASLPAAAPTPPVSIAKVAQRPGGAAHPPAVAAVTSASLRVPVPLPKRPSSEALRTSFAAIKPLMRACVAGRHGVVTIRSLITANGRISQGSVEGVFQTPDERGCMTRAILELRVPPFEQQSFSIEYLLAL